MLLDESYFKEVISSGQSYLGIEFGSTRIKAVLIDIKGNVLGTGVHDWENHLQDGIWTYPLEEVWEGFASCYVDLSRDIYEKYNTEIKTIKAFGISAMMHGYLPFDKDGNQLAEFRTWRNNITEEAADKLTNLFNYNIPQRWSIAHLYQAILNNEDHVEDIDYLTTLAGYVHWKLTGKKVVGIGEASGMFPIKKKAYNKEMLKRFHDAIDDTNITWKLDEILPEILIAGDEAGTLTEEGAKLLDPSGVLQAGAIACPPEGDAGTGMVATNSLKVRTGNISAGTSAFAMVVLEKELKNLHIELDMVTTPSGDLVAMSHANNCTTEINNWVKLFSQLLDLAHADVSTNELYTMLFQESLNAETDCSGLVPYCFHSGEDIVGLNQGCPMFIHPTKAKFNLANFMRSQLYSCFAAMKLGIDILVKDEGVKIDKMVGHGGIFTTPRVAQKYLSAAIGSEVEVISTASEGGAWGIALLAAHIVDKQESKRKLFEYIDEIFKNIEVTSIIASEEDIKGYKQFIENFQGGMNAEVEAVKAFNIKDKE